MGVTLCPLPSPTPFHSHATPWWPRWARSISRSLRCGKRIDADHFFELPAGDGWSVAANLAHLVNATRPVTKALRMPRIALWALFGTRRSGSRSFLEVATPICQALAAGGSSGKFTPERRPPPENPAEEREKLLHKWRSVVPELTATIRGWNESAPRSVPTAASASWAS